MVAVEYGAILQFINEYEELESVDPLYWTEAVGVSDPSASVAGVV